MTHHFTIGVDYGTNSVRAVVADIADGRLVASSVFDYPSGHHGVLLDARDPHLARQNPVDYLDGLRASVEGALFEAELSAQQILEQPFQELLAQVPLLPSSQNLFVPKKLGVVSHLRLNIFPDGGVARFRAYGKVAPSWRAPVFDEATRAHVAPGAFDLADSSPRL